MTDSPHAGRRRLPLALATGLLLVAGVRLLTRPFGFWEYDEFLFAAGIERFDPVQHRPHPPGYPLLIGLGKLFRPLFGDPFHALVALSIVSSLIGFAALFFAFRRIASRLLPEGGEALWQATALAGALTVHLSPAMLVHGPMPMSDPPMLMFVSLALWAATRLEEGGEVSAFACGLFASAAIGCRPQIAVAVLPLLLAVAWIAPGWRQRFWGLAGFTALSLAWFLPLLAATGGLSGFLALMHKQGALVAQFDSGEARLPYSVQGIAFRFLAHPWGDRWTSFPVLGLAAIGAFRLLRSRGWLRPLLPLAVLTVVHLGFCLAVMEPRDGVRYSLAGLPGVAFLAALGLVQLWELAFAGRPRPAWAPWALLLPLALLVAGFGAYAGALLKVRSTTPSPTVQAAQWVEKNLPQRAVFLADPELEAPATHLLPRRLVYKIGPGLEKVAYRRGVPVYLLGDGESVWPEAQTFRWPESDAYGKLTRNHYRVVSVSKIPPGWRYIPVRGVYNFEPSLRERGIRWMAQEAVIRVAPRCGNAIAFTLALPANAPWPSNGVEVSAGTLPPQRLEVARGGTARVVVPLPPAASLDVSFRSRLSFVPEDGRAHAMQLIDAELLGH